MGWIVEWTNSSTGWSISSNESLGNAKEAYAYLTSHGYTANAAIGVVANLRAESYVNPGQWQIGYSIYGSGAGFGLGQWTPWTKVRDALGSQDKEVMSDGNAQMNYLVSNKGQWGHGHISSTGYSAYYGVQSIYFSGMDDYAKSTASPEDLAVAWAIQWERPSARYANLSGRRTNASYYAANIGGTVIPTASSVTLTIQGEGTATYSPLNPSTGDIVTLSATPAAGQSFIEWRATSGNVTITDNKFIMPEWNVSITAVFTGESEIPPSKEGHGFGVYTSVSGNGAIVPSVRHAVKGETVTLYIDPWGSDVFTGWEIIYGDIQIVNNQFVMPASWVSILGTFSSLEKAGHGITFINEGNLQVGADPSTGLEGTQIEIWARRGGGHRFKGFVPIYPPGLEIRFENGHYYLTMPDSDVIILVEYTGSGLIYYLKPWYIENTGQ